LDLSPPFVLGIRGFPFFFFLVSVLSMFLSPVVGCFGYPSFICIWSGGGFLH
jgi:hypothetical protein